MRAATRRCRGSPIRPESVGEVSAPGNSTIPLADDASPLVAPSEAMRRATPAQAPGAPAHRPDRPPCRRDPGVVRRPAMTWRGARRVGMGMRGRTDRADPAPSGCPRLCASLSPRGGTFRRRGRRRFSVRWEGERGPRRVQRADPQVRPEATRSLTARCHPNPRRGNPESLSV